VAEKRAKKLRVRVKKAWPFLNIQSMVLSVYQQRRLKQNLEIEKQKQKHDNFNASYSIDKYILSLIG
jgi:hypothetical protein